MIDVDLFNSFCLLIVYLVILLVDCAIFLFHGREQSIASIVDNSSLL